MPARHKVLALMFALTFITYLDRVCISATATAMSAELGMTKTQMGQVLSAFVVGYVLFEIPGGWLADRYGARSLLTRIVVWWSAFTALTGVAWNFASLLVIRFLFGCGEAGAFPGCASALSRWFPRAERGRAQAVIMVGSRLGGAFAPGLVIAVMSASGWRSAFWIFAAAGIVWAAIWAWWYRNSPEEHPSVTTREIDAIRFGRDAGTHTTLVPWAALLRHKGVWALCAMYSGYAFGLYFYLTWLPTYLQEGRGVALSMVGFYAALPFLAGAVCNLLGGWLTDYLSRRVRLRWARRIPAMGGLVAAAGLLTAAALIQDNTWSLAALALSFGAADLILAVCWATCLDIGREHAGTVSGAMNSLGQIGGVIAPALIGWLVESTGAWQLPLLIAAGYYAVSALLWLAIDPEKPLPRVPANPLPRAA
jgi:MFS family permease